MLKGLRSTEDKKAVFKKGDKLITSNVINNNTIEYIINSNLAMLGDTFLLNAVKEITTINSTNKISV